ncbi:alpha/beta fold hydrolase [Bradyrhizobium sp. BR 10289]|uniref:lipase family alpha/beta hydrolase n=1 Tax=Bradyrhizobium sp. BR 10289 TaxID=2749993 RepID=UPI001C64FBE8|nr:alpha/beta fold hydrolase [Bradyrhizobium sp. BR 10289]MBW7974065.1 alpha/beta fold hydrolase [Bradyrhizobium sp. BR 10289]
MPVEGNRPKIVVTIHGIRTTGVWQKQITPYLAKQGLIPYHIDYGYFLALAFLFPPLRQRQVEKVRKEMRRLVELTGASRISVIAHSFGTYLAMEALRADNGELKYDRVVLTGCILANDFSWTDILNPARAMVMAVRNERATKDWVVSAAAFASRRLYWITRLRAGDAGRTAFEQKHPALLDYQTEGGHSEVHNQLKFEQWARFIAYPLLPPDILDLIIIELDALRQEVARAFQGNATLIRINLFAPIAGALRIVPGATVNMNYAPELDLKISPDHGATGTAFKQNTVAFVIKGDRGWGGNLLPGKELDKLHPQLKWVLSFPIYSKLRETVIAVVSIDGLETLPAPLQADRNSDEFKGTVMLPYPFIRDRISPYLDIAFRGEKAPETTV